MFAIRVRNWAVFERSRESSLRKIGTVSYWIFFAVDDVDVLCFWGLRNLFSWQATQIEPQWMNGLCNQNVAKKENEQ